MDDEALYAATVPVLLHYLDRLDAIAARGGDAPLSASLAEGMFAAGQQFASAQGFAIRATCPVIGRGRPELPAGHRTVAELRTRSDAARGILRALTPADFQGAAARTVAHIAGQAELRQDAVSYVTLFAMPNFFFHLSMGYAALRAKGVPIGKADYDGLHAYAPDFHY